MDLCFSDVIPFGPVAIEMRLSDQLVLTRKKGDSKIGGFSLDKKTTELFRILMTVIPDWREKI